MSAKYAIGLDYGTNSVRALIVNTANGREVGTAVWNFEHGAAGVIRSRDPNLARQHPADYIKGAVVSNKKALADAKRSTYLHAMRLAETGRVDLHGLVSHRFPLKRADEAFRLNTTYQDRVVNVMVKG